MRKVMMLLFCISLFAMHLQAAELDLTTKALEAGDPAPALAGVEWLKGDAVDPAAADTVKVIAIWTAREPSTEQVFNLLDELQNTYPKLKVVGLTKDPVEITKQVLEKVTIDFTVGSDPAGKAIDLYMAGAPGMPYSVVIGKDGKVVWAGHPLSMLKRVVEDVEAGTYDPAAIAEIQKLQMELQQVMQALQQQQASPADLLTVVDKLIAKDPTNGQWYSLKIQIYKQTGVAGKIPAVFQLWFDNAQTDADSLVAIGGMMMEMDPTTIDPSLAVKAAQKAWALDQGKNFKVGLGVARVYEKVGLFDKAIEISTAAQAGAEQAKAKEVFGKYIEYLNKLKAAQALVE